jgi:hypothetical protein
LSEKDVVNFFCKLWILPFLAKTLINILFGWREKKEEDVARRNDEDNGCEYLSSIE